MIRPLAHSALLVSVLLSAVLGTSMGACKGESQCASSDQCANGFVCNLESKSCEAATEPDARVEIDAAMACPESTHFCAPTPPEGWTGPMAGTEALSGEALSTCPASFPTEEKLVYENIVATGECSCTCPGVSSGFTCGNAVLDGRSGTGITQCNQMCLGCLVLIPPTGACTTADNSELASSPAMSVSLGRITNTGQCSNALESNDLEASFERQARYCSAPPVEASCPEAGTCLPNTDDASFDRTCIFQAGDLECPSDYPTKHLRFTDLEDTRSCSSCNCSGPAVGTSCGGTLTYSRIDVQPTCALTTVSASGCVTKPQVGLTAKYVPGTSFSCSKSGAELSGEVTGTEPTTVCCLPEP